MSSESTQVSEVTKNTIELLKKIAKDNTSGGDFQAGAGSFRVLFEPDKNDNTPTGLIETLNRNKLEAAWQQTYNNVNSTTHDSMKLAIQNDFVCQIHRDLQHRYSGRITRILHENARKEVHAQEPRGAIQAIQSRIENFMRLSETKQE
jgi:hypothetical protein